MPQTRFGILCESVLREFETQSSTHHPFQCIWKSQVELANAASLDVPDDVLRVDPDNEATFVIRVSEFYSSPETRVLVRNLDKSKENWPAWHPESEVGKIHPKTKKAIISCLRQWIRWDELPKPVIHHLSSGDIQDRYDLTAKQIRDWAKDDERPFLQRIKGKNKYSLHPEHPELKALAKKK